MKRELPVRIREGLGVKLPRATRLIITGTSRELLRDEVRPLVAQFLQERGLTLSPEKTAITHREDGFDFLGQHVRRYPNGVLLVKPSQKNVTTFLTKIRHLLRTTGQGLSAGDLIRCLNPKIRGWALYPRHMHSKRTFYRVDHEIFRMLWQWARRRHGNKGKKWIKKKYFTSVGMRSWAFFGDSSDQAGVSKRVYLFHARDLPIRRHEKVQGEAHPYDPAWEPYWENRWQRRLEGTPRGRTITRILWRRQQGRCALCGELLDPETNWQIHHIWKRVYGGEDLPYNLELLHYHCHQQKHHSDPRGSGSRRVR